MQVAVVGTGYVGLVSGTCLADIGHNVICLDIDPIKIERLKRGEIPIYEPGLADVMRRNIEAGRLSFTTNYADAIPGAKVAMIAVGTPSAADGAADLTYLFNAAEEIARHLTGYAVVIDKSTVPVGTVEEVRERVASIYKGEFGVVSNPEFLREGRAVMDFLQPDRVVIGSDSERATQVMLELYAPLESSKIIMSPRSAELTKYAANAFLATKVSFINEIAHLSEELGADIEEVAAGIGSDRRIGPRFLHAGLGWGGSCFPKDVKALLNTALRLGHDMPIVKAAGLVNDLARTRITSRLDRALGGLDGKSIGLLGLAFKKDTDDTRESAALALIRHLYAAQAKIRAFDPAAHVHETDLHPMFERVQDLYAAAEGAHAVVIATDWDIFREIDLPKLKSLMEGDLIFDARNLLAQQNVCGAGFRYMRVGCK